MHMNDQVDEEQGAVLPPPKKRKLAAVKACVHSSQDDGGPPRSKLSGRCATILAQRQDSSASLGKRGSGGSKKQDEGCIFLKNAEVCPSW